MSLKTKVWLRQRGWGAGEVVLARALWHQFRRIMVNINRQELADPLDEPPTWSVLVDRAYRYDRSWSSYHHPTLAYHGWDAYVSMTQVLEEARRTLDRVIKAEGGER